ncbi:MAG TPA: aldo/keto reductase [Firmicutes bacterium]|nr:aldo/keto reductase [Bacillota bacterium]
MEYRDFGKTGIKVSALGFGAMRLPNDEMESIRIMQMAIDLGVNYIDTAFGYGDSEIRVGKAIRGRRDKVFLSTKNPIKDASGHTWMRQLETSLKRLGVDCIDFYHMHNLHLTEYETKVIAPGGPLDASIKARSRGMIRHLSFSSHDEPQNVIKLIDTGVFDTVLLQYNLLDRKYEEAIAHAHAKGMGVAIMGPVGGGRLAMPSDEVQRLIPGGTKSTPELALRFVLANPNVSVALSGMGSMKMVLENVRTASRQEPLTPVEYKQIQEALNEKKGLAELYCTGCNYCMPCPNGIDIPQNFAYMNYFRLYGLRDYAREGYSQLASPGDMREGADNRGLKAEYCLECGACEPKCPQHIPIIARLKEVARVLGTA